jgi:flavin-dependent dehydrogenase
MPIAAHLVGDPSRDEVRLAPETLDAVPEWHGEAPDVIIDASGRRRTLSRLLQIPASVGPRKDVAHFAHYEGCAWPAPAGQVEIARLEQGWSWRIPLPGPRLSIGVVIPREHAQHFGASGEEQLEEIIANDRHLAAVTASRRRVTRVATYANYQLISERGSGKGWAMVGDAFGFVDPMLSPGLSMAMVSAERLAAAIPAHGVRRPGMEAALAGYGRWFRDQLEAWQNLVSYFYDGRIFAIHRTGADIAKVLPRLVSRTMERHVARNLAGMASGALTARPYPRWLLQLLGRHTAHKHDPAQFAIA